MEDYYFYMKLKVSRSFSFNIYTLVFDRTQMLLMNNPNEYRYTGKKWNVMWFISQFCECKRSKIDGRCCHFSTKRHDQPIGIFFCNRIGLQSNIVVEFSIITSDSMLYIIRIENISFCKLDIRISMGIPFFSSFIYDYLI